jgi:hypothetical protein
MRGSHLNSNKLMKAVPRLSKANCTISKIDQAPFKTNLDNLQLKPSQDSDVGSVDCITGADPTSLVNETKT